MATSEAAERVVAGELRTPRLVFRLPEPSLAPALSDYLDSPWRVMPATTCCSMACGETIC